MHMLVPRVSGLLTTAGLEMGESLQRKAVSFLVTYSCREQEGSRTEGDKLRGLLPAPCLFSFSSSCLMTSIDEL